MKMRTLDQNVISLLVFSALFVLSQNLSCLAAVRDIAQDLPDDYLGTEFAWAMILDLPDMKHYLNYPNSKLRPVEMVRVHLRTYASKQSVPFTTFYEEFWYHKDTAIGLRRHNQITLTTGSNGAIIVCPGESNSPAELLQRAPAIANSIVRLAVDVQFRNALTGLVLVPESEYESISQGLSKYGFFPSLGYQSVGPVNIHLRAYPQGKDEYFYFRK